MKITVGIDHGFNYFTDRSEYFFAGASETWRGEENVVVSQETLDRWTEIEAAWESLQGELEVAYKRARERRIEDERQQSEA